MAIALQGTRYSGHHFSRLKQNRSKKRQGEGPAYLKGKLGIRHEHRAIRQLKTDLALSIP